MKNFTQYGMNQPGAAMHGAQSVTQATMKFFGMVLGLAAVGLWLVPGAMQDGAEMLVRLVMSFLFFGIAAGMWGAGRAEFAEEFHLDVSNHRLNHVLRGRDGIARLQGQYGFDEMEEISLTGGILKARLTGGQEVLRVAVGTHLDPSVLQSLQGLRKRPAM